MLIGVTWHSESQIIILFKRMSWCTRVDMKQFYRYLLVILSESYTANQM